MTRLTHKGKAGFGRPPAPARGRILTGYLVVCAENPEHQVSGWRTDERALPPRVILERMGWTYVNRGKGWSCPACIKERSKRTCVICGTVFEGRTCAKACSPQCVREKARRERSSPEARKRQKKWYHEKGGRARMNASRQRRFAEDPEYRNRVLAQNRERQRQRMSDPTYKAKYMSYQLSRYHCKKLDPEWLENRRKLQNERNRRKMEAQLAALREKLERKL